MRYVLGFARFWYDFIVGDDWRIAVWVLGGFGVTWLSVHDGFRVWWLLPAAVAASLTVSVMREARAAARRAASQKDELSG